MMAVQIPRMRVKRYLKQEENVLQAINNGELVYGSHIEKFKKYLTKTFNRAHVSLTNSGNSALLVALIGLGLKNKKVLIPSISTCFAMVNAIQASGNIPVFADVDLESGNIDIKWLELNQPEFDAILSPNHFGILSNTSKFKAFGKPVIEDACQSFLTNIEQNSESDALVFSFYPTKVINAIDGGAILVSSQDYKEHIDKHIYYDYQEEVDEVVSYNLKMNNVNCAFGLGTIDHLEEIQRNYQSLIQLYDHLIKDYSWINRLGERNISSLHKYVLRFNHKELKAKFVKECLKAGIGISNELLPLVELPENYPNALTLVETTCSIPLYSDISDSEMEYLKDSLEIILNQIGKDTDVQ